MLSLLVVIRKSLRKSFRAVNEAFGDIFGPAHVFEEALDKIPFYGGFQMEIHGNVSMPNNFIFGLLLVIFKLLIIVECDTEIQHFSTKVLFTKFKLRKINFFQSKNPIELFSFWKSHFFLTYSWRLVHSCCARKLINIIKIIFPTSFPPWTRNLPICLGNPFLHATHINPRGVSSLRPFTPIFRASRFIRGLFYAPTLVSAIRRRLRAQLKVLLNFVNGMTWA